MCGHMWSDLSLFMLSTKITVTKNNHPIDTVGKWEVKYSGIDGMWWSLALCPCSTYCYIEHCKDVHLQSLGIPNPDDWPCYVSLVGKLVATV